MLARALVPSLPLSASWSAIPRKAIASDTVQTVGAHLPGAVLAFVYGPERTCTADRARPLEHLILRLEIDKVMVAAAFGHVVRWGQRFDRRLCVRLVMVWKADRERGLQEQTAGEGYIGESSGDAAHEAGCGSYHRVSHDS